MMSLPSTDRIDVGFFHCTRWSLPAQAGRAEVGPAVCRQAADGIDPRSFSKYHMPTTDIGQFPEQHVARRNASTASAVDSPWPAPAATGTEDLATRQRVNPDAGGRSSSQALWL